MREKIVKINEMEQQLIKLKKTPLMMKALPAEALLEKMYNMLRTMAGEIEELKNNGK